MCKGPLSQQCCYDCSYRNNDSLMFSLSQCFCGLLIFVGDLFFNLSIWISVFIDPLINYFDLQPFDQDQYFLFNIFQTQFLLFILADGQLGKIKIEMHCPKPLVPNTHTIKNYSLIHNSHYDYWAYPLDRKSSYGNQYKVFQEDYNILKKDKQFIEALRINAILVCRAWRFNLQTGQDYIQRGQDQKWHDWPIRLYKMSSSLQLFSQYDLLTNSVKYAKRLMKQQNDFTYGPKDLKPYYPKFDENGVWNEEYQEPFYVKENKKDTLRYKHQKYQKQEKHAPKQPENVVLQSQSLKKQEELTKIESKQQEKQFLNVKKNDTKTQTIQQFTESSAAENGKRQSKSELIPLKINELTQQQEQVVPIQTVVNSTESSCK